ncbi:hypothetical protein [Halomonas sp. H10-9-1]|uniref:hypothetical protein n=1 Tax=Halomonas sp. H10-9-1 TaxID=2950871 RepID=UPI0032DE357C
MLFRNYFLAVALIIVASGDVVAAPFSYQAGKLYCGFTHPAELVSPIRRSTCEEQHVIQQQSGGVDEANVVWWSASSHVRTDLWSGQPWQNNRPWVVFGFTGEAKQNLEKAYMLGTFGKSWSLFQHSYQGRGESSLVLAEFDGMSNALYMYSWFVNLPQKYLNQVAYISDRGYWHLLVDMVIAIVVLGAEGILAIASSFLGMVVGTVLNPIDTVSAIPGGIWLAVEATIAAVAHYVTGIISLATSGIAGLVLTPFAVIFSVLPFMALSKIVSRGR